MFDVLTYFFTSSIFSYFIPGFILLGSFGCFSKMFLSKR